MPLGTDTLIPDRIAELLEEKCDVMIAPTIPYGATNTIYGCPGTIYHRHRWTDHAPYQGV